MKISVVMAVYNEEKNVLRAVNGILNQTYKDFELIIVNDGSSDATQEKLLQIDDSRVKIINFKENNGASSALHYGVNLAKGEWIAIHDADDLSMPNRLEEQLEHIRSKPELGALGTFIQCTTDGDMELAKVIERKYNSVNTAEQIEYFKHYALLICHGSVIFSKELYEKVGGYNPIYRIAYDYDLWLKMLDVAKFEKIDKALYQWKISGNSLHRKNEKATCDEVMTISLRKISKNLLIRNGKKPKVTIVGTKKACENLEETVLKNTDLFIPSYKYDNLNQLWLEKKQKDAIIVLEGPNSWDIVEKLKAKGFKINKNLYHLWNIEH